MAINESLWLEKNAESPEKFLNMAYYIILWYEKEYSGGRIGIVQHPNGPKTFKKS